MSVSSVGGTLTEGLRAVTKNTHSVVIRSLRGASIAIITDPDSINIFEDYRLRLYGGTQELRVPVPWYVLFHR